MPTTEHAVPAVEGRDTTLATVREKLMAAEQVRVNTQRSTPLINLMLDTRSYAPYELEREVSAT